MNKSDLIDALADHVGGRATATKAVETFIETVTRAVSAGEKVAISGFGVFEKADRAARTGRNPSTGEPVKIKKTSVPKFRPGTDFKAYVSGAKKFAKTAPGRVAAKAGPVRAAVSSARATASKAAGARITKAPAKAAKTASRSAVKAAPARRAAASKTAAKTTKAPARTARKATPAAKTTSRTVVKSASRAPAKKATAAKTTAARSTAARTTTAKATKTTRTAKAPAKRSAR